MRREIVLIIETAIGGGSLSIFENSKEIDSWIGNSQKLKDENLLATISKLISRNKLQRSDISKIVYSIGPGSLTGIRICGAIVRGLKTALGCETIKFSVLEALTLKIGLDGVIKTAIQISKNQVIQQFFEKDEFGIITTKSQSEIIGLGDFFRNENILPNTVFLQKYANISVLEQMDVEVNLPSDDSIRNIVFVQPTENLAGLLGIIR